MAKIKTTETDVNVADFISSVESETQRYDSRRLIELMRDVSRHPRFGKQVDLLTILKIC